MVGTDVTQKQLSIGGLSFLLRATEPRFWQLVDQRYANFYTAQEADPDEIIDFEVMDELPGAVSERAMTAVEITEEAGCLHMVRGRGRAAWQRDRHWCRIQQPAVDLFSQLPRPDYVVDSVLRVILSYRLLEKGGMLIHSTGLIRDGEGYLFVGKSGVGKSTVARLSAQSSTILNDDLTILLVAEHSCSIFGTPFFGEFATAGVNRGAPLVGIYFLQQAPEDRVIPLSRRAALTTFMHSLMMFDQGSSSVGKALGLAAAVCEKVPSHILHFTPQTTFWKEIDRAKKHPSESADGLHRD